MDDAEFSRIMSLPQSWSDVPGYFDYETFYDRVVREAPESAVFVEIGCYLGRSTCYLATRIRESGKAIRLYAVDRCTGSRTDEAGQELAEVMGGSYAGLLHRNVVALGLQDIVTVIVAESVTAASLFAPRSVHFCYIDGDHDRLPVLADLDAWTPRVRPGGILAGHDYNRPDDPCLKGVTEAVAERFVGLDLTAPEHPHVWQYRIP